MSQPASVKVPADADLTKSRLVETSLGAVEIRSLDLEGAEMIVAAIERIGFDGLPFDADVESWLTPEQREELKQAGSLVQKAALLGKFRQELGRPVDGASAAKRMVQYVLRSRTLLPVVVAAFTNLPEDRARKLKLVELIKVMDEIAAVVAQEWPDIVTAATSFFSRLGGLMDLLNKQISEVLPGLGKEGTGDASA